MATLASGPLSVSGGATGAEATLGAVILVVFVAAAGLQAYLVRTRRTVNGALRDCERRSRRLAENERALRAERQRGRLVISSANEAYLSVDHAGIVIDWNQRAETTFGWRRNEIIGRRALDVLATERYGEVDRRRFEWMRRGQSAATAKPVRTAARHRDGRDIPVEVSLWEVGTGDQTTFSAFLRDVTRRLETERGFEEGGGSGGGDVESIAERLDQIGGGDRAAEPMLRSLVQSFLDRIPGELDELDAAVTQSDGAEVAARAHRLRGTAVNLGARSLADSCTALETAARANHLRDGPDLIDQARHGYADAERTLRTQLTRWRNTD